MARSLWAWVQTCPDKGKAFLLCRSCCSRSVCVDGLSSPSSASGLAVVWRICHCDSSGLNMPENAMFRRDVGTTGKGTAVAGPASWAWRRLSSLVWADTRCRYCTPGLEILMWALSLLSQICVLQIRLKSILRHPLGCFKTLISSDVHSFSGQHLLVLHCSQGKEFLPNKTWHDPNLSSFSVKQFPLVWSLSIHVKSYSPSFL